jgi:AMP-binding enzyme
LEVRVERGVSIGERTEADQLRQSAGSPDRALTERILEIADGAGYRAALINATDGSVTTWPRFAGTVRAAARGLARRGLAEGDTAGMFVQDAASAAIAVNAIRAAGARACLIRSDASPAEIAGRLNACGARVLITSAPLAELAAEGADRSRVRQVIAFGEAAGTTPFSSLLGSGRHSQPDEPAAAEPGFATRPGFTHESGRPEEGNGLTHERDLADAGEPGSGRGLTYRDVVVACPPCGGGQAYTALLDLTLLTGATLAAAPLPLVPAAIRAYKGSAAVVPPGTAVPGLTPDRIFPVALSPSPYPRRLIPVALSPSPYPGRCPPGAGPLAVRRRWPLPSAARRAPERA